MSKNFKEEKRKLKRQENFFFFLFWFLIALIIFAGFKYQYEKKITPLYYEGKFGTYVYDSNQKTWNLYYNFNNKTYIVPFEMHPKEFENFPVKVVRKYNNEPYYIFIVYKNNTNLSYVTKASVNLGRILNVLGYYSYVYLYPAYLLNKNGTFYVQVLNRNLSTIAEGPLDCNMNKALFIILEPESNKTQLVLDNSCILVQGKGENFSKATDKLTLIFMKTLLPSPFYRKELTIKNATNNTIVSKIKNNSTNKTNNNSSTK